MPKPPSFNIMHSLYYPNQNVKNNQKTNNVESLRRGKGSGIPYHLRTSIPMNNLRADARQSFYRLN
jgi:hypothetical protein